MKQLKWNDIRTIARTPKAILATAVSIGLAVNLIAVSTLLLPKLKEEASIDHQLADLDANRKQLEVRPIPAKLSAKDLDALIKQVPLTDDSAGILIDLRRLETKSGAVISSISLPGQGSGKDEVSVFLEAQKQGGAAASPTPTASSSPTPTPQATQKGASPFEEYKYQIELDGTYPQVLDFVNLLYQMDRVVSINNWSLTPFIAQGNAAAADNAIPGDESADSMNRLAMEVVFYSAKGYASRFGNAAATPNPLPELSPPGGRTDPTMTDEAYLQLLESLQRNPN